MMEGKRKISVCPHCAVPMIWTFKWSGCEWFCLNCGDAMGMCSADETEITPELKFQKKVVDKIWKVISPKLLPNCHFKKNKCKKCWEQGVDSHWQHITKRELRQSKEAERLINKFRGIINRSQNE